MTSSYKRVPPATGVGGSKHVGCYRRVEPEKTPSTSICAVSSLNN